MVLGAAKARSVVLASDEALCGRDTGRTPHGRTELTHKSAGSHDKATHGEPTPPRPVSTRLPWRRGMLWGQAQTTKRLSPEQRPSGPTSGEAGGEPRLGPCGKAAEGAQLYVQNLIDQDCVA